MTRARHQRRECTTRDKFSYAAAVIVIVVVLVFFMPANGGPR